MQIISKWKSPEGVQVCSYREPKNNRARGTERLSCVPLAH